MSDKTALASCQDDFLVSCTEAEYHHASALERVSTTLDTNILSTKQKGWEELNRRRGSSRGKLQDTQLDCGLIHLSDDSFRFHCLFSYLFSFRGMPSSPCDRSRSNPTFVTDSLPTPVLKVCLTP